MKYMEHFESSSTFTASSHVVETGKLRAAELLLFKTFLEYLCGKFADTSIDRYAKSTAIKHTRFLHLSL